MTIDAHFHAWQLARGDYAWLTPDLAAIYRDVSVADWQENAVPEGVRGGVLVQAAPTDAETLFLLQQADHHDAVLGVVGWVDCLHADAPARIHKLAQHAKLKGLRPMLQDIADPAWILQATVQPALEAMAESGSLFDALVKPAHLPHLLTLAKRHPALKIVIDHGAKPAITMGERAMGEWEPWAQGMARLARETSACCKLSGLLTEAAPGAQAGDLRPWVDHLLHTFGPDRLLWGSDWPVLELRGTYSGWRQMSAQLLAGLSDAERQAVFGGNARRVYGLKVPVA